MAAPGEYGQDYAVAVGTPINAPFAGIFHSEDNGKSAWGKRGFVRNANGQTFAVGHLTQFAAQNGQSISKGQTIGYSGGALNDPSSGNTTGPHVETQFIDQFGKYINPAHVFAQFPDYLKTIFGAQSTYGMASHTATANSADPAASAAAAKARGLPTPADQLKTYDPANPFQINIQMPDISGGIASGISSGLKSALPSTPTFYRGLFSVLGGLMIAFGVVLYFKGDEIKQAAVNSVRTVGRTAEVAAVA
jgi:Peptidase family M23